MKKKLNSLDFIPRVQRTHFKLKNQIKKKLNLFLEEIR